MNEKMSTIFSKQELDRISIKHYPQNKSFIFIDVHGMKCYEAKRFINNIININRESLHLVIIHGYNNGTAIKDMLATKYSNKHIYAKYQDQYNKGLTHMCISA